MKNVSLLAIGGILGAMTIRGDANASIVSRNFLENALTDYAKTTALDLKADKADVTDLSDKIGTLPSGNFPEFPGSENLFSSFKHPHTYPTSLAELITTIYGSETNSRGLLTAIIEGFQLDTDGDGNTDASTGLIPNFWLAKEANDLANANTAKIGTLPTEYTTVGAALTAIKGIAEEAKAAAVAAIPDPKAEGSSGKYVLTVDIIGDNATYRWEKIDRSESESTTTE